MIKDNSFRRLADDGSEKTANSLLRQRINNFLIIYFGYLALALAFIIFVAGWFLFIYPKHQRLIKSVEAEKNKLQTEYESKTGYLSAVRNLKDSYQSISGADRKKIEAMVPVGNRAISLIPEIESIALKNGVILNSIKIVAEEPGQSGAKVRVRPGEKPTPSAGVFEQLPEGVGLTEIEVSLSSVNYAVLKNLFKVFENNLWLLDIAKVDYNVEGNTVIFTIYSYYLTR